MKKAAGLAWVLGAVLVTAWGVCNPDIVVKTRDGKEYRLPVQAGEVESISFTAPPAGDKRADQKQEDREPAPPAAGPAPVQVGPTRQYKVPSAAAKRVKNGAVVEIDAADYHGDVAIWKQNDLTLRGVGGRPHLIADGKVAQGKAIWVVTGDNVTIENIEFSGARARDRNGSGIRYEGNRLTLRNSYFHDNEMGLLSGGKNDREIVIEGCEFAYNTVDYQRYHHLGHNIYVGPIKRFVLTNSYVHDASIGHNVKSRARETLIMYNRITDEKVGSSYLIDLPNSGRAYVIGNLLRQGPKNDNRTLISYGAERGRNLPDNVLFVVNNTMVNDDSGGTFVKNHTGAPATLINNLLVGPGTTLRGPGEEHADLSTDEPGFRDRAKFDYRLTAGSEAIDKGVYPDAPKQEFPLTPSRQYVHPHASEKRPVHGAIDVGAYEF